MEMGELDMRRPAKEILAFYSNRWPDDRKEMLVNRLAFNGYFRNVEARSYASSAFLAMMSLEINAPSPNFLLQVDVQHTLAVHISDLYESAQRKILDGLEAYLELPLDDGKVQLESCELYNRIDLMK